MGSRERKTSGPRTAGLKWFKGQLPEGERLDLCISGGLNWVQGLSVATRSILTHSEEEPECLMVRQLWWVGVSCHRIYPT